MRQQSEAPKNGWLCVSFAALTLITVVTGAWALFAPESFLQPFLLLVTPG